MNWYYGVVRGSQPAIKFGGDVIAFSDERGRVPVSRDPNYTSRYVFIIGMFSSREDAENHARKVGYSILCHPHP